MNEEVINEILTFIKKCDNDFTNNLFSKENYKLAKKYSSILKHEKQTFDSAIIDASIKKLDFISKQIYAHNYHSYNKEAVLNLVSLSVTDYIINLIREKHLTDPLLISRYAYIELSKVLYYDISYVKQNDYSTKTKICNTNVDLKKEKIFSYVVCTQWLQLYTYILNEFDINVTKRNIPGQDHVWGEIKLDNNRIIIVDATEYINSSIDLSNAKSTSPTVGFVVLPKEYSKIKLYDVFYDIRNMEIAKKIKSYYELNRDLDITLGYISKEGYPAEKIIKENELFNYSSSIITNEYDIQKFLESTVKFFENLAIPNNIDGYEIFAYYNIFIKKLPKNITANISQKTLYVDSFSYKKNRNKKFLQAPIEYLKYLNELVYNRYYKYLSHEENNILLEQMKKGYVNGEQIRDSIAKYEMIIADINRKINLYYAINELKFYNPITSEILGIHLYEPMIGTKTFNTRDEYNNFKKTLLLK